MHDFGNFPLVYENVMVELLRGFSTKAHAVPTFDSSPCICCLNIAICALQTVRQDAERDKAAIYRCIPLVRLEGSMNRTAVCDEPVACRISLALLPHRQTNVASQPLRCEQVVISKPEAIPVSEIDELPLSHRHRTH